MLNPRDTLYSYLYMKMCLHMCHIVLILIDVLVLYDMNFKVWSNTDVSAYVLYKL